MFTIVLVLGLAGRVLTMAAYWPALFYIDSSSYLTNRFTLSATAQDPIGYSLILRVLLDIGHLGLVVALQHAAGLAMAACIYALLLRKGAPRWLGALAAVPVLLDAYEWQIEQTILSDSLFLAMVTFAVTILAWNRRPSWKAIVSAGLLLGCASVVRTVGEVAIVPAAIYVLIVAGPTWRRRLATCALLTALFAVPLLGNAVYASFDTGGSVQSSQNLLYGRLATVADCSQVPSDLRSLCPSGSVAYRKSQGPDHYAHDPSSPVVKASTAQVNAFDDWVLEHQPLAVAEAVGGDFVQLFISPRATVSGGTDISRWQFQTTFQTWTQTPNGYANLLQEAGDSGNGHLDVGIAQGLRAYQLDGGYTPGWFFGAALLAGLIGLVRRRSPARAQIVLWTGTGLALLLGADFFEFSWRYQLPALVFLPMGGAFAMIKNKPLLESYPDTVDTDATEEFHARHGGDLALGPVVVLIAAYNEAESIGAVLDKLPAECHGMHVDPLVVVDGATDATAQEALAHGAYTCVAPTNRGQGAALRLGYHLAHEAGARYVVTTDADGQYDTAELPRLLAPIMNDEADFTTGSRILGRDESGNRVRLAGCRFFAALVSVLMKERVTDTSFGLRAMRAQVPVSVTLRQPQYQSSELLIGVLAQGYRVHEVPMTIARRDAGRTKKGNALVYGSRYARVVLGTWWRERRSEKTRRSNSTNLATNTMP
ncbi:glycosyltransferase family 2 protein [Actinospica sp.]|uniref:glycosyltransferase family 2 protein n=1 Tax=Actinospica sp. TaxID=1872142 RepID=UPI002BF19AB0|nr:glycosyltransferase family 2 protein [Actinospica sp.]HWG28334.1 glycosyltransferase family 2 protein [Actinospica sp.]